MTLHESRIGDHQKGGILQWPLAVWATDVAALVAFIECAAWRPSALSLAG